MRSLTVVLLLLLALLQSKLWFSDVGVRVEHRLAERVQEQQVREQALGARNNRLRQQISALNANLDAIESRARTDLGMVKADEVFYFFPPTAADSVAAAPARPATSGVPQALVGEQP